MYNIYKMEIAHYLFPLKEAGLPCSSVVKNPCANAGETEDAGLIPGSGRYPGERNGSPCQYSCLKNPMDRGAWQATVHGVAKSQTQLSDWSCVVLKKIIEKLKLEDGGGTEKEKEKQAGRENWREAEFKEKVTQPNLHVLWNFQAQEQCSQNTETLDCKVSLRNVREVKLLNPTCNGSTRQPGDHKAQQYSRGRTAWASCPMIRGGEGAFTCIRTVSFSELGCKAKVATWFPTPRLCWTQRENSTTCGARIQTQAIRRCRETVSQGENASPWRIPAFCHSLTVMKGSMPTVTLSGTFLRVGLSRDGGKCFPSEPSSSWLWWLQKGSQERLSNRKAT